MQKRIGKERCKQVVHYGALHGLGGRPRVMNTRVSESRTSCDRNLAAVQIPKPYCVTLG